MSECRSTTSQGPWAHFLGTPNRVASRPSGSVNKHNLVKDIGLARHLPLLPVKPVLECDRWPDELHEVAVDACVHVPPLVVVGYAHTQASEPMSNVRLGLCLPWENMRRLGKSTLVCPWRSSLPSDESEMDFQAARRSSHQRW